MAGNLSNYAEDKILDHLFRTSSYTMPADCRLAAFTSDPGEAGSGAEVTDSAYGRQILLTTVSSGGAKTNSVDVVFPVALVDWGQITHLAVFDAASGGNMLWHSKLDTPISVLRGDQLEFLAGSLQFGAD